MSVDTGKIVRNVLLLLIVLACVAVVGWVGIGVLHSLDAERLDKTALGVRLGFMAGAAFVALCCAVVMAPGTVPFAIKTSLGLVALGAKQLPVVGKLAGAPATDGDGAPPERREQSVRATIHRSAMSTGMLPKPGALPPEERG